jgi:hypothetical protein
MRTPGRNVNQKGNVECPTPPRPDMFARTNRSDAMMRARTATW